MAFTLLQVGAALKSVNPTGGFSAALTLPGSVQLAVNRVPRFAKFKAGISNYVVVVNTPTRPVSVDVFGNVRVLTPAPPNTGVVLAAGISGNLAGAYEVLQTYKILDSLGNVVSESDYGPLGSALTLANQTLNATFPLSGEPVSATQLYRTTSNGGVFFPWLLINGNTTGSVTNDNTSDASLSTIAGPSLGSAPDLTLIAEFGGRLWGVSRTDVDDLRYTEAGTMYGWSALNTLTIPKPGADAAGITTLIARRSALGVARRDVFTQITGSDRTNIQATTVNGGEAVGSVSQEAAKTWNDVVFFLARDGVYTWDASGIKSITNGKVRSWFTSDQYFNKAMFWRAFAEFDQTALKYRLFLASAGSAQIDRWIEFDLTTQSWFGPHKTDAMALSSAVLIAGNNQQPHFMIGSQEGYLSVNSSTLKDDWGLAPIAFSVQTKRFDMGQPDYDKFFGEVSVFGKAQAAGTVTVTPTVGEMDTATPSTPLAYDMTQDRQRLGRIGVGKQTSLLFEHATADQDVALRGFEINPVNVIGRR